MEKKLKYKKPELIAFNANFKSRLVKGVGCGDGSGATPACDNGIAPAACATGSVANPDCQVGNTPIESCGAGTGL